MPTEATKKQTEHQNPNTGSKPQGTQVNNEDTRSAEQHYGGHRDPHIQGGAAGTQQNPQGKQESPVQPGQTRERGGSTEHSGPSGGSSSQYNPPPAQQGQHGQAGGPSDRGNSGQHGQNGQKKEREDNQNKDQRR
jgi:hypothetical protein